MLHPLVGCFCFVMELGLTISISVISCEKKMAP